MALSAVGKLYRAEGEREVHKDPEVFAAKRCRLVGSTLEEFRAWLQRRATQVPPETLLGKAVNYTLTQWPKLVR